MAYAIMCAIFWPGLSVTAETLNSPRCSMNIRCWWSYSYPLGLPVRAGGILQIIDCQKPVSAGQSAPWRPGQHARQIYWPGSLGLWRVWRNRMAAFGTADPTGPRRYRSRIQYWIAHRTHGSTACRLCAATVGSGTTTGNFPDRCANLALNAQFNVQVENVACSDRSGWLSFDVPDYRQQDNFGNVYMRDDELGGQRVRVMCLDELVPGDFDIGLIKIDVEGFSKKLSKAQQRPSPIPTGDLCRKRPLRPVTCVDRMSLEGGLPDVLASTGTFQFRQFRPKLEKQLPKYSLGQYGRTSE